MGDVEMMLNSHPFFTVRFLSIRKRVLCICSVIKGLSLTFDQYVLIKNIAIEKLNHILKMYYQILKLKHLLGT